MTAQMKFKLIGKDVSGEELSVSWVCGVSEGTRVSTGMGYASIPASFLESADEEIIEQALLASGGDAFLSELRAFHSENLQECVVLAVADDWYTAYAFYCAKVSAVCDAKADALENIAGGFGSYGLDYNHSIFNATEGQHWSHTFAYTVIENEEAVVYHIKVRDGQAVEWYKSSPSLTYNGEPVEWVSLDLSTGTTLEFYKRVPTETPGITRMEKFEASTGQLATSTVHGPMGAMEIPAEMQGLLDAAGFEHGATVFGYATKSYGQIVEYTLRAAPNSESNP